MRLDQTESSRSEARRTAPPDGACTRDPTRPPMRPPPDPLRRSENSTLEPQSLPIIPIPGTPALLPGRRALPSVCASVFHFGPGGPANPDVLVEPKPRSRGRGGRESGLGLFARKPLQVQPALAAGQVRATSTRSWRHNLMRACPPVWPARGLPTPSPQSPQPGGPFLPPWSGSSRKTRSARHSPFNSGGLTRL